jgi:hypothetical protein
MIIQRMLNQLKMALVKKGTAQISLMKQNAREDHGT